MWILVGHFHMLTHSTSLSEFLNTKVDVMNCRNKYNMLVIIERKIVTSNQAKQANEWYYESVY